MSQTNITHFVYDGHQVVADLDENGNIIRSYTWGPGIDNLLSMTVHGATETNTYFALKDHLNSVLAFTDSSGSLVESYEYDAWGRVLSIRDGNGVPQVSSLGSPASSIGNRYLWQGREYDSTTGLYYFRARWYNSETGRWLSKDPIGIAGGLNLYVFCENNPVNFIDPWGLCKDKPSWWNFNANQNRAEEIFEEVRRQYPGHNDLGDAMRHAEASRRIAIELGSGYSWLFGTAHEMRNLIQGDHGLNEARMDLHNNAEGRKAANEGRDVDPNNLQNSLGDGGRY